MNEKTYLVIIDNKGTQIFDKQKSAGRLIKISYRNLISLSQKSYEFILIAFFSMFSIWLVNFGKFYRVFLDFLIISF